MAEFGEVHPGVRIVVLLLLIIVLTLGGILWFDYLGVLNARSLLSPVYRLFGVQRAAAVANPDDPLLLDRERLAKQSESLNLLQTDLNKRAADLNQRQKELDQLASDLKDREQADDAKEKAFNERVKAFENRSVNLAQTSKSLTSMPPKNAVDIMSKMDDQDVIDIIRVTDQQAVAAGEDSVTPLWFSMLPADRAAALQRKMAGR